MRYIALYIFIIGFGFTSFAQEGELPVLGDYATHPSVFHPDYDKSKPEKDKISVEVQAGAGVMTGKYGTTFSYVAPTINYQLSPKLKIGIGMFSVQNYGGKQTVTEINNSPGMSTTNYLKLYGTYKVSEKLTISGSYFGDIKKFANDYNDIQSYGLEREFYDVNLNYSITPNVQFNMGVSYSNFPMYRNYYYGSPFLIQ